MPQSPIVEDILGVLEKIASFGSAESWDNVGLLVGDPTSPVTGILVALDPTDAVLDEALALQANLIVTHHPIIFHPLKAIRSDRYPGALLHRAIANHLNLIGCHTNLDAAPGGVNDALAVLLGLIDVKPLETADGAGHAMSSANLAGMGRYGRFSEPVAGPDFLTLLCRALNLDTVAVAGTLPALVETVAVCGGSGSDLASTAREAGAQVLVTAEIKHSTGRWAEANDFCLVDGGHFATENPVVMPLAERIKEFCIREGWEVDVRPCLTQRGPFVYYRAGFNHIS